MCHVNVFAGYLNPKVTKKHSFPVIHIPHTHTVGLPNRKQSKSCCHLIGKVNHVSQQKPSSLLKDGAKHLLKVAIPHLNNLYRQD